MHWTKTSYVKEAEENAEHQQGDKQQKSSNLHLINKDELNQELRVLKKRIQQHHEKQERVKGQKEKKRIQTYSKDPNNDWLIHPRLTWARDKDPVPRVVPPNSAAVPGTWVT